MPDFTFYDLDGKPVTPESLAGKVAVLDFWATWCPPCRESLPNLEKVYQRYKDNPKVAFYAVSVDDPKADNKMLVKTFEDLKVHVPILRDTDKTAAALKFSGIPTMFIIGRRRDRAGLRGRRRSETRRRVAGEDREAAGRREHLRKAAERISKTN